MQGAPAALWQLECPQCEDHLRADPLWSSTVSTIPETPDEQAERADWKRRSEQDTQFLLAATLAKLAGQEIPESMQRALNGGRAPAPTASVSCPNGHGNQAGSRFCSECGAAMSGVPAIEARAPERSNAEAAQLAQAFKAASAQVRAEVPVPVTELEEPERSIAEAAQLAQAFEAASGQVRAEVPVPAAELEEPEQVDLLAGGGESGRSEDGGQGRAVELEAMSMSQLKALAADNGVAVARSKADQLAALRAAGF